MKKFIDDRLIEELNQIHVSDELKSKVLNQAKNMDVNKDKVGRHISFWKTSNIVAAALVLCVVFNVWLFDAIRDNTRDINSDDNMENAIEYDMSAEEEVEEMGTATIAAKSEDKITSNKKGVDSPAGSMEYVKTKKKLKKLVNNYILPLSKQRDTRGVDMVMGEIVNESTMAEPELGTGATREEKVTSDMDGGNLENQSNDSLSDDSSSDYSETNVQVQGVDESDIVKTDGKYIYYVNRINNQIFIVDAKDNKNLKVAGKIDFNNQNVYVNEIYLDNNKLVAILNEQIYTDYYDIDSLKRKEVPTVDVEDMGFGRGFYGHNSMVVARVYNISDLSNIELERTVKVEGNYVSSRKINNNIYLISNKFISYYETLKTKDIPEILPRYEDTAKSNKTITIKPSKILYTPDMDTNAYIIMAGFDINNKDENANITTILGNAQSVYASSENLYLTSNVYNNSDMYTNIYSFALDNGKVIQKSNGSVKGSLLNQYSMDEFNGYFRLATTSNSKFSQTEAKKHPDEEVIVNDNIVTKSVMPMSPSLYNHIYVLNDNLDIVGTLNDLAEDERIYSTRFFGDKLYMVTFKTVDPLFVIDLSEPTAPKVLGELKIPGYSNYLHMYDENHVIGIGQDTKSYTDEYGERTINLGLKVAIFDVTDVNNPIVKDEVILGGQGSYTTSSYDFKSVLFSKEKNLLAFPATITEKGHGDYQFEGALVFDISLTGGLSERGRITHQPNENSYIGENYINRILYIKDTLFTLSNAKVQSNNINNCEKIDSISIK